MYFMSFECTTCELATRNLTYPKYQILPKIIVLLTQNLSKIECSFWVCIPIPILVFPHHPFLFPPSLPPGHPLPRRKPTPTATTSRSTLACPAHLGDFSARSCSRMTDQCKSNR